MCAHIHQCVRNVDSKLGASAQTPAGGWSQLWQGVPQRKHVILAVHFAWAMYILLFNSMVLNIAAYGQRHLHVNTMAIGELVVSGG